MPPPTAAPDFEPRTRASCQVVKAGRTISVVDARAWQRAPGSTEDQLVATMTATVMTVLGRGLAG
jgi:acyl-coenzyme A thioesterase PaaI-like protein